jgi:hypothetical protein
MKDRQSYFPWIALPFLIQLILFGSISILNWDYMKKLVLPDESAFDWMDVHLGQILLTIAFGLACAASFILFVARLCRPSRKVGWYMAISLILVSIFLVFPSVFIIVLGPAAITMKEQMRTMPRQ